MTPTTPPDVERLLDAAETLFYERGYQAVGMDALRSASGLPLKRIYALYPGKEALAVAMLDRRDERWHRALAAEVDREPRPERRVSAVFRWLESWLAGEGHRGCAFINAFGELGGTSPTVVDAVRRHQSRFRTYVGQVASAAGAGPETGDAIHLLAEGCMVTTGITGDTAPVRRAAAAADRLLQLR